MSKKKHKNRTENPSKISGSQGKILSNKSKNPRFTLQELNIKSNFITLTMRFLAFLSLTLFIFYFLRSLEPFSYMVLFYSSERILADFFILSFGYVAIFLVVGSIFVKNFDKIVPGYSSIFLGLNGIIITLIIYPITTGYNPIMNYPLMAIVLFVVDIVVEFTPIVIGYKIYKNIKSI